MGTCSPFAGDHTVLDPVCGCDGVTYWNGAYLSGSMRSAQSLGPCNKNNLPPANACTVGNNCGGGTAHCVFAKADCASMSATGTCWILPDKCDNTVANEFACEGIMDGNCTNVCDMIFNNMPFHVTTPACLP